MACSSLRKPSVKRSVNSAFMRSRRFLPVIVLGAFFGAAVVWANMSNSPLFVDEALPATAPLRVERAPYDPNAVHQTLEFYAKQTRADPKNALFAAALARQYLESFRETGDAADAVRAERAARASLAIRTHNNSDAFFQLSRALLAQHRFSEALIAARKAAISNANGLRQCADIEFEIGDYAGAARDLKKAAPRDETPDPAYLALRSRWSELHGKSDEQLALLHQAVQGADADANLSPQSVAWFHERLGRALFMTAHVDEAEKSYLAALKVFPRDYRTMAALQHLHAARGDWKRSIEWGERAAHIVPAPETFALLGDAHQALGQPEKARAQWKLVEQIAQLSRAQGAVYDRQRALFYADHNRNLPEAVKLARGELRLRRDIYAFDTLAWTLFKAGRVDEAWANSRRALAFGTRDASLYFHAGTIAAALDKSIEARTYLARALEINPYFHATQPKQARALLARLEASSTKATPRGSSN